MFYFPPSLVKAESAGGHSWGLTLASWKRNTLGVKLSRRQQNRTFWTREWPGLANISISPQRLNDHLSVSTAPSNARNPYSQKQTRPIAALLPPNSRSRKAQRRPTHNTEVVLWIRETLRYQEKSTNSPIWPMGKVRHRETD